MKSIIAANCEAYEQIADLYAGDGSNEDDPTWRAACRNLFASRLAGNSVLEIGCGPGLDTKFLADLGLALVGTDLCPSFVRIARSRYPNLQFQELDVTVGDGWPGVFHGIFGQSCFLHIPKENALSALINIRTHLLLDGLLFLSLISSKKFGEYTQENWGGKANNPAHFFCYSQNEMAKLLRDAGFSRSEFFQLPFSKDSSYKQQDVRQRMDERGLEPYQLLAWN